MIQVYFKDQILIERLRTLFDELGVKSSIDEIDPEHTIIVTVGSARELLEKRKDLKVMVLSDTPSFLEGSSLLQKGIKGYANTYIHLLHLNQAIDIIESGNIWLYPSFMQELIANSMRKENDSSKELLEKLTIREQETALLIAEGKTNKEIAIELKITERTVKAHLTSIYTKTGLSDRFSLAKELSL